jgi:protein-S-isoprenylcysteine O-methyltransferase Ste14
LLSPWSYASLGGGAVLTVLGAIICLRWYIFWKGNYKGKLLTTGPYARVRHPFYAGFLSLAIGLAILIPIMETVMLAVFSVVGILFYIQREEELLIERYGRAYEEYMRRVRWRIIPRVY